MTSLVCDMLIFTLDLVFLVSVQFTFYTARLASFVKKKTLLKFLIINLGKHMSHNWFNSIVSCGARKNGYF